MRFFVILIFALLQIAHLPAQQFDIVSAKITFEFPSKNVKGSISGFESESVIDWNNPSSSVFKGSVKVATLNTNNGIRNWSLRSSRYFNAKNYPKITFSSNDVLVTDEIWTVTGDLTIKGITKPFTIKFRRENGRLIGSGTLYSTDFDIKIKKEREDNRVNVQFVLESKR